MPLVLMKPGSGEGKHELAVHSQSGEQWRQPCDGEGARGHCLCGRLCGACGFVGTARANGGPGQLVLPRQKTSDDGGRLVARVRCSFGTIENPIGVCVDNLRVVERG